MKMFCVVLLGVHVKRELTWPVVHYTENAVLVKTEAGNCWFRRAFGNQEVHFRKPVNVSGFFSDLSRECSDELLEVHKAGKGPSEKSHKFRFEILRQVEVDEDAGRVVWGKKIKTITLPVSVIKEVNGKFYSTFGVLSKKLAEYEKPLTTNFGYHSMKMAIQSAIVDLTSEDLLADQLAEAAMKKKEIKMEEMKIAALQRTAEIEAEKASKLAILRDQVATHGEAALAYCNQFSLTEIKKHSKSTLPILERPKMPTDISVADIKLLSTFEPFLNVFLSKKKTRTPDKVLHNVKVEWVDWGGTSKQRTRIEQSEEGCTVKFFGKKVFIETRDGDEITKMLGPNLIIHE